MDIDAGIAMFCKVGDGGRWFRGVKNDVMRRNLDVLSERNTKALHFVLGQDILWTADLDITFPESSYLTRWTLTLLSELESTSQILRAHAGLLLTLWISVASIAKLNKLGFTLTPTEPAIRFINKLLAFLG